jgi:cation transport ATPase
MLCLSGFWRAHSQSAFAGHICIRAVNNPWNLQEYRCATEEEEQQQQQQEEQEHEQEEGEGEEQQEQQGEGDGRRKKKEEEEEQHCEESMAFAGTSTSPIIASKLFLSERSIHGGNARKLNWNVFGSDDLALAPQVQEPADGDVQAVPGSFESFERWRRRRKQKSRRSEEQEKRRS